MMDEWAWLDRMGAWKPFGPGGHGKTILLESAHFPSPLDLFSLKKTRWDWSHCRGRNQRTQLQRIQAQKEEAMEHRRGLLARMAIVKKGSPWGRF